MKSSGLSRIEFPEWKWTLLHVFLVISHLSDRNTVKLI